MIFIVKIIENYILNDMAKVSISENKLREIIAECAVEVLRESGYDYPKKSPLFNNSKGKNWGKLGYTSQEAQNEVENDYYNEWK